MGKFQNDLSLPVRLSKLFRSGIPVGYFAAAGVFILIFVYRWMFLVWTPENVDDSWFLSFIYNLYIKHTSLESTFGSALFNLNFFGKTYALIYLSFLNAVGWTKTNAHLLSIFLSALSLLNLFFFARVFLRNSKVAFLFVFLLGISEAFFSPANSARPEAVAFFLMSLSLLLAARGYLFPAGMVCAVLLETHPAGVVMFLFLPGILSSHPEKIRAFAFFIAGCLFFIPFYFFLHPRSLSEIMVFVRNLGNDDMGFMVERYFHFGLPFFTDGSIHVIDKPRLAEGVALAASCAFALFFSITRKNFSPALFLIGSAIGLLFLKHQNSAYLIFFWWPFILACAVCLNYSRKAGILFAAILIFSYVTRYNFFHGYNERYNGFEEQAARLRQAIPRDERPILGSPNAWFSFMDREFYPATYTMFFRQTGSYYFIEDDNFRKNEPGYAAPAMRAFLRSAREMKKLQSLNAGGRLLTIFIINR